jgi:hypothetical protein
MVIVPVLRGLFGIEMDAATNSLTVDPRLPADWNSAELTQLHVGKSVCSVSYQRDEPAMRVSLKTLSGTKVLLKSRSLGSHVAGDSAIVALPDVEVAMPHGLPLPGARTEQIKVLAQSSEAHSATLDLEGQAGSAVELAVRLNKTGLKVQATGATLGTMRADGLQRLLVTFPTGVDYQAQRVVLSW